MMETVTERRKVFSRVTKSGCSLRYFKKIKNKNTDLEKKTRAGEYSNYIHNFISPIKASSLKILLSRKLSTKAYFLHKDNKLPRKPYHRLSFSFTKLNINLQRKRKEK